MGDEPNSALLMFVAHRAAEARVFDAVRAADFDNLTLAQSRIGQRLDRQGIRVTDLAEQAGVTKQTAGALVDELEANGYVERKPDPADARARLVVLTDRGAKLCARVASAPGAECLRRIACRAGVAARRHRSVPLTVAFPQQPTRRCCAVRDQFPFEDLVGRRRRQVVGDPDVARPSLRRQAGLAAEKLLESLGR